MLKVRGIHMGMDNVLEGISAAWMDSWHKQVADDSLHPHEDDIGSMEEARSSASGHGGWTWSSGVGNRIDTEVTHVLLAMLPVHRRDGEGWLGWHMRRDTWIRNCISMHARCTWSEHVLLQCAKCWQRWAGLDNDASLARSLYHHASMRSNRLPS